MTKRCTAGLPKSEAYKTKEERFCCKQLSKQKKNLCKKGTSLQEEFGFLLLILILVEQSLESFVTQKNCMNS